MSSLKPLKINPVTVLLSFLFSIIVSLRNLYYSIFPPKDIPFLSISVGGISTGGTGKTPVTAKLIEKVIECGKTPLLLTRGYGRKSKELVTVLANDKVSWRDVGDEPAMLKQRYPDLLMAISGNRWKGYNSIKDILPEDTIIIMDDGFQHRQFPRTIDIVTLPSNILNDKLFPIGYMREPLSALNRADYILVLNGNESVSAKLRKLFIDKSIRSFSITEKYWYNLTKDVTSTFINDNISIFSGIARPQRFVESAKKLSKRVVSSNIFPDHHNFTNNDYTLINSEKSTILGTTEKDSIRLDEVFLENQNNLWYLIVDVTIDNSNPDYFKKIIYTHTFGE